ncbi:MAG: universal stress protein [Halobacteriota archaeon]
MKVLVPVDGSDDSFRALTFAVELCDRFGVTPHVVHFTDHETDATDEIMARARSVLEEAGVEDDPELVTEVDVELRTAGRVGKEILSLVEDRGYDHVVMGHHGSGTVERAILGSAAETVVRSELVPVTIVP